MALLCSEHTQFQRLQTHKLQEIFLSPGLIKSDFAKALWENETILKAATSHSALKRIGMPDEIAGAAVFLASDAGAYITGQNIVINGGDAPGI